MDPGPMQEPGAGSAPWVRIKQGPWGPGFLAPGLVRRGIPHLFTTRASHGVQPMAPVHLDQVHGASCFDADGDLPPTPPRADAAVTTRPGRVLSVRTADCVPILLADRHGSRVAAIHAGWRGLVAGVIPSALARFGDTDDPAELLAAIGPCLSREHFEVGPEVAHAFCARGLEQVVVRTEGSRPHVDLAQAAERQLRAAGVEEVERAHLCTWKEESLFYSHRRDVTAGGRSRTGRQGALIAVRNSTAPGAPLHGAHHQIKQP